ncbi:TIGR03086 family metal-binding protein [Micromonospora zhanjiangensis]|uniref:TIGR03086 family metal-binding protein n=1 Tax=Micromonospora zhanjiangensis TaxID=1522057 RepID=A0ABV8KHQ2_9ACTN
MAIDDLRDLDRRAVRASVDVLTGAAGLDLTRPTPCAGWNLGELLAHMTVQHHGFAAAAEGNGADPAVWRPAPPGADPVGAYVAAADRVVTAFADPAVPERTLVLPEISDRLTFPAAQAIGFHFIDYVVHGWDLARALGRPYELDPELAPAALAVARQVPDGERRLRPGASFAPGLPVSPDAPVLDQILALLGRSPAWPD